MKIQELRGFQVFVGTSMKSLTFHTHFERISSKVGTGSAALKENYELGMYISELIT